MPHPINLLEQKKLGLTQQVLTQWIGSRENLHRKPIGFYHQVAWLAFPINIFPSSNSVNQTGNQGALHDAKASSPHSRLMFEPWQPAAKKKKGQAVGQNMRLGRVNLHRYHSYPFISLIPRKSVGLQFQTELGPSKIPD